MERDFSGQEPPTDEKPSAQKVGQAEYAGRMERIKGGVQEEKAPRTFEFKNLVQEGLQKALKTLASAFSTPSRGGPRIDFGRFWEASWEGKSSQERSKWHRKMINTCMRHHRVNSPPREIS